MTVLALSKEDITIPTPLELSLDFPRNKRAGVFVENARETIRGILQGVDPRLLMIVGPCSIHDEESTLEYAEKFRDLAEEVSDDYFLVMRAYFEKPRTTKGWKGLLYDPHLDGSYDMVTGLRLTRKLLVTLTEMEIPLGSELLEINTAPYISDLLSWGCIGARTVTSQPHRQLASSLNFPIGFKNTTDGNMGNAINGILSASVPHHFLGMDEKGQLTQVHSKGNADCHIVLRGGEKKPNFDEAAIQEAKERCIRAKISHKIIVDCSHDNCKKNHEVQKQVFKSVLSQASKRSSPIRGLMLESHLYEGSQKISPHLKYGVSITDPCLDWKTTKNLISRRRGI